MKKWYSGDRGIVEATMPFRNSCACKPVTESTALRGTGATVGVFRNSERTAGGSMVVEAKVAERSSESAYSPLSLPRPPSRSTSTALLVAVHHVFDM